MPDLIHHPQVQEEGTPSHQYYGAEVGRFMERAHLCPGYLVGTLTALSSSTLQKLGLPGDSVGFPGSSVSKESACYAGDLDSIPGSGRFHWRRDRPSTPVFLGFPGGSDGKKSACNVGDLGLVPGLGRSLGGRHGNPFQYSCLKNPHGPRSLTAYSPWGCKKSDMTE